MDRSVYIRAMELDKSGDWDGAHNIVQELTSREAAWIHAYLHRKEGDRWNAQYWYDRAGQPFFEGSLDKEWTYIVESLKG
jgi:hypothetical protein